MVTYTKFLNGFLMYEPVGFRQVSWNEVATSSNPVERQGASLAMDPSGRLWLFGGYDGEGALGPGPTLSRLNGVSWVDINWVP